MESSESLAIKLEIVILDEHFGYVELSHNFSIQIFSHRYLGYWLMVLLQHTW